MKNKLMKLKFRNRPILSFFPIQHECSIVILSFRRGKLVIDRLYHILDVIYWWNLGISWPFTVRSKSKSNAQRLFPFSVQKGLKTESCAIWFKKYEKYLIEKTTMKLVSNFQKMGDPQSGKQSNRILYVFVLHVWKKWLSHCHPLVARVMCKVVREKICFELSPTFRQANFKQIYTRNFSRSK